MADLTITISESLNVFGPAPSNKWNEYNWNAFFYGEGNNAIAVSYEFLNSETLTPSDAFTTVSDFEYSFSETLTPSEAVSGERLSDPDGYSYIFTGGTTNAASATVAPYTSGTFGTGTWTSSTVTTTTWS